jgi:RNA polymerase primary sigma factor
MVEAWILAQTLYAAVKALPDLERKIIVLRYGLAGGSPESLGETRRQLGLARWQTTRLEQRALGRLARRPELVALHEAA